MKDLERLPKAQEDLSSNYPVLVSVIVPNYNGRAFLDLLLRSLEAQTFEGFEVVLVDNGSTDGSVDLVRRSYPHVKIVENSCNLGYAGGCNLGIASSYRRYVLLLNNDVQAEPNLLEGLVKFMEESPDVAAAQPKIKSLLDKRVFDYAGAAGGLIDSLGYPFCRGRIFTDVEEDRGQYDGSTRVFWASGTAAIIRRDVFEKVGLLDEMFFFYQEEIDLCWRINLAGLKVAYVPSTAVYHHGGYTADYALGYRKIVNLHRNNLFLMIKNLSGRRLAKVLPIRIMLQILSAVLFTLAWREPRYALAVFVALYECVIALRRLMKERAFVQRLVRRLPDESLPIGDKPVVLRYVLSRRRFPGERLKLLSRRRAGRPLASPGGTGFNASQQRLD